MGLFGPRIGEVNNELAEMNERSARLGYDMWSEAAADLLGDRSIRRRGITAKETRKFLEILRDKT